MKDDRKVLVERATNIVVGSHLSPADKKILLCRLPYVQDMVLSMFVELCAEEPFSIESLVRNLKMKIDAMGNLGKLHALIERDRREVDEAIKNKKLVESGSELQPA